MLKIYDKTKYKEIHVDGHKKNSPFINNLILKKINQGWQFVGFEYHSDREDTSNTDNMNLKMLLFKKE